MIKEKCACKGSFFDKLIQPAVLAVLAEGPSYGLEILNIITEKQMTVGGAPDTAGFYRMIKKMEEDGLMTSEWVSESKGGKMRRMLTITEDGRHCLDNWHNSLMDYGKSIGHLVLEINRVTAKG